MYRFSDGDVRISSVATLTYSLEDFELVTGEVRSRGLRLSNGILYALYEGGTVVLLR